MCSYLQIQVRYPLGMHVLQAEQDLFDEERRLRLADVVLLRDKLEQLTSPHAENGAAEVRTLSTERLTQEGHRFRAKAWEVGRDTRLLRAGQAQENSMRVGLLNSVDSTTCLYLCSYRLLKGVSKNTD